MPVVAHPLPARPAPAPAWDPAALTAERDALAHRMGWLETELARCQRDLDAFAYVASHDLQEPLRMVASYVSLLQRRYGERLDADADAFIGFATDGATRMQDLLSDLLAYSRVTRRGEVPVPTRADVALDRALSDLADVVDATGAVIERAPLPLVLADGAQLAQLLTILLDNALKFRSGPRPLVRVSAVAYADAWRISVADDGIGLDTQYTDRVFEMFQRLHGRDEHPGNGIGLAIARQIVERHGGRIWFESAPDAGATFHVTFPRVPEETR